MHSNRKLFRLIQIIIIPLCVLVAMEHFAFRSIASTAGKNNQSKLQWDLTREISGYFTMRSMDRFHGKAPRKPDLPGFKKRITELIAQGADINRRSSHNDATPLEYMITFQKYSDEDMEFIEFLLQKGADPNSTTMNGTPILQISPHNVRKILLKYGANINGEDAHGNTLLYHLLYPGSITGAKELIEHGAKFSTKDREGSFELLHNVLQHKDLQLARTLLYMNLDPNAKSRTSNGVHDAYLLDRFYVFPDAVELLLTHGADPNKPAISPIAHLLNMHGLAWQDQYRVVELLLKHGADPNGRPTSPEGPLLIMVLEKLSWQNPWKRKMLRLLIDHKADVNVVDRAGNSLLYYFDDRDVQMIEALLKAGLDPNKRFHNGETPLTRALKETGPGNIPEILLSYGANPDLSDGKGNIPLMNAVEKGDVTAVRLLLKYKANANSKDGAGHTALSKVLLVQPGTLKKNRYETVKLLLEGSANPNIRGKEGVVPLDIAYANGFRGIVDLLVAHGANKSLAGKGRYCGSWETRGPDGYRFQMRLSLSGEFGASADIGRVRHLFSGTWERRGNELIFKIAKAASRGEGGRFVNTRPFVRRARILDVADDRLSLRPSAPGADLILKNVGRNANYDTSFYWN